MLSPPCWWQNFPSSTDGLTGRVIFDPTAPELLLVTHKRVEVFIDWLPLHFQVYLNRVFNISHSTNCYNRLQQFIVCPDSKMRSSGTCGKEPHFHVLFQKDGAIAGRNKSPCLSLTTSRHLRRFHVGRIHKRFSYNTLSVTVGCNSYG